MSQGLASNDSNGSSDNPAGIIILILFLVLAAAAAAFVVYKGWAKPIARSVAMWVRGDTDANAYIRNRDSAPQAIAKALVSANLPHSKIHVCERLGYEDQKHLEFVAKDLASSTQSFAPLHVTLVHTLGEGNVIPNFPGIADTHFVTDGDSGKGLLTKREVRLNILSLLQASPQDIGWDIGAGCGGVAIEWALWNPQGKVYGIEDHSQRVA
mgnify:CR=1 FL=1